MPVDTRDRVNLTDYFMRCSHEALVLHAHLLGAELFARELQGAAIAFNLSRMLERQRSAARTQRLARL